MTQLYGNNFQFESSNNVQQVMKTKMHQSFLHLLTLDSFSHVINNTSTLVVNKSQKKEYKLADSLYIDLYHTLQQIEQKKIHAHADLTYDEVQKGSGLCFHYFTLIHQEKKQMIHILQDVQQLTQYITNIKASITPTTNVDNTTIDTTTINGMTLQKHIFQLQPLLVLLEELAYSYQHLYEQVDSVSSIKDELLQQLTSIRKTIHQEYVQDVDLLHLSSPIQKNLINQLYHQLKFTFHI